MICVESAVRCPKCSEAVTVAPDGASSQPPASGRSKEGASQSIRKNPSHPPLPAASKRRDDRDVRPSSRERNRTLQGHENRGDLPPGDTSKRRALPWIIGGAGGLAALVTIVVVVLLIRDSGTTPAQVPAVAKNLAAAQPDNEIAAKPAETPAVVAANDAIVKSAAIPVGALPANIDPSTTRKVKKATAYLRVKGRDGKEYQGSGFFAVEPGMVFTNAHVLGMLDASATIPPSVDVVVNSGEKDEFTRPATVLGADRDTDLAIVQVQGGVGGLPEPLPVDTSANLTELQKVYIFGFPYGPTLGKNITVSESSISSLRKEEDGTVYQIQVNGGMNPGNSGGPVVDARGVVIGVSVAIIVGTQINFAVPGEKVLGIASGRIQDVRLGHAYSNQGEVKLPVSIVCLDPMRRIRTLEVDVWTGAVGKPRPASGKSPSTLPGDGQRQTFTMKYQEGKAVEHVVVPPLPLRAGEVVWLQPAFVNQSGIKFWGPAQPYERSDSPALERVPAQIMAKLSSGERTLKLSAKSSTQITKGREKLIEADDLNVDVLESLSASPKGALIRLLWAKGEFMEEFNGTRGLRSPDAYAAIKDHVHGFECAPNGALSSFGFVTFNFKDLRKAEEANDMAHFFLTSYQLTSLPFPNRIMQPAESWNANIRLLMGRQKKKEVMDVVLKCTYEGVRKKGGKQEAFASLVGEIKVVKTERPLLGKPSDRVSGFAVFDTESGQVASLEISLNDERELAGTTFTRLFAVSLTRSAGNSLGIAMPAVKPAAVAAGKPSSAETGATRPAKAPTVIVAKGAATDVLGGGFGRDAYTDVAPAGGVLTGLEIGLGKFANIDVIHSVRAVFRVGDKETTGRQHGTNLSRVLRLVAKPGYAVGAVTLQTGANVDGLSLTFMRIKGSQLDSNDAYESEYVGDGRPGNRKMLTGNGRLVVGINGLQSKENNTGLGLVFDAKSVAATTPEKAGQASAQPPGAAKPSDVAPKKDNDAAANQGGKEFAPKNGMYAIIIPDGKYYKEISRVIPLDSNSKSAPPGNPKIKSKAKKGPVTGTPRLAIEGSLSLLADKTTGFTAASIGVPATIMRDIPQNRRFEVFRNVLVDEMKGKVTDEKDVVQDSVAGKEYLIEKPDGFAKLRLHILAGWVIYVVAEVKNKEDLSSTRVNAFFTSFKMTDKAQDLYKQLNKDAD